MAWSRESGNEAVSDDLRDLLGNDTASLPCLMDLEGLAHGL